MPFLAVFFAVKVSKSCRHKIHTHQMRLGGKCQGNWLSLAIVTQLVVSKFKTCYEGSVELKDLIASEKAADVTLSVGKGAKRGWQAE